MNGYLHPSMLDPSEAEPSFGLIECTRERSWTEMRTILDAKTIAFSSESSRRTASCIAVNQLWYHGFVICTYVFVYIGVCECVGVYVFLHACMQVSMYACMHVCVCVCACVCMCVCTCVYELMLYIYIYMDIVLKI